MTKRQDLRDDARMIFQSSVEAADPAKALRAHMQDIDFNTKAPHKLYVIAIGKAAVPMMREALRLLPKSVKTDALIVTNYPNAEEVEGARLLLAGHPVPDENGEIAAKELMAKLEGAREGDQILALISGGASALLPAPPPEIALADKARVNEALMKASFEITELNLVRQQISGLKGGGMTRLAAPAPVTAFILSDVIGDDLRVVASGPTVTPIGSKEDALALVSDPKLKGKIPNSVIKYLENKAPEPAPAEAKNILIGSNSLSLKAARDKAESLGWKARIVSEELTGAVEAAAQKIVQDIQNSPKGEKICLLYGGETSVEVKGAGKGGRNQEMALRVAMECVGECADRDYDWVFLSGGTDGLDGPTDAAGGVVDDGSIARMKAKNIDPMAKLENSDSYHALMASDDLLMTGATGTNVADIQIALIP